MLDFEHFKQLRKSVTGSDYQACKFGPVASYLTEEWKSPCADFSAAVSIVEEQVTGDFRRTVTVKQGIRPNVEYFTPRQLRIMDELSQRYGEVSSSIIMADTEAKKGVWYKVWRNGAGERQIIVRNFQQLRGRGGAY